MFVSRRIVGSLGLVVVRPHGLGERVPSELAQAHAAWTMSVIDQIACSG